MRARGSLVLIRSDKAWLCLVVSRETGLMRGRHSTLRFIYGSITRWSTPESSGKNNYNRPRRPPIIHRSYIHSAHLATPLHMFAVRRSYTKS